MHAFFTDVDDAYLVKELISALDSSVKDAAGAGGIGIAFSGGLDSGIAAALAKRHGRVMLYTAGKKDSYDIKAGEETASLMGLPWKGLEMTEDGLEKELREMIGITGTVNPITLSFEVPLYYVLKYSEEKVIMGGQGADELFLGYSKYIGLNEKELADMVRDDTARLMNETLAHEKAMAEHFGKKLVYPYLDGRVADLVGRMGMNGVRPGDVRKPLLREAAKELGQPELAERPKKAAQYGSGTMALMRSIAKKKGMTVRETVTAMAEELKR